MTTEKVQLEVRLSMIQMNIRDSGSHTAAFLTQTVALDDGTSVKFEIW